MEKERETHRLCTVSIQAQKKLGLKYKMHPTKLLHDSLHKVCGIETWQLRWQIWLEMALLSSQWPINLTKAWSEQISSQSCSVVTSSNGPECFISICLRGRRHEWSSLTHSVKTLGYRCEKGHTHTAGQQDIRRPSIRPKTPNRKTSRQECHPGTHSFISHLKINYWVWRKVCACYAGLFLTFHLTIHTFFLAILRKVTFARYKVGIVKKSQLGKKSQNCKMWTCNCKI